MSANSVRETTHRR